MCLKGVEKKILGRNNKDISEDVMTKTFSK